MTSPARRGPRKVGPPFKWFKPAGLALLFPALAGLCGPAGAVPLQVTGTLVRPTYYHGYSTAQIEAMSRIRVPSRASHEPGLTRFEHELSHQYEVEGEGEGPGRPLRVWARSLRVDFSITRMDVYVSSQYARGTCPYNAILAHENTHVAINDRAFRKYKALLERALKRDRTLPTKAHPLRVSSLKEGKAVIERRLSRIVEPLYERFKREDIRENAKIDTPASYRRTQAKCGDW